jgi:hypothetical protein
MCIENLHRKESVMIQSHKHPDDPPLQFILAFINPDTYAQLMVSPGA